MLNTPIFDVVHTASVSKSYPANFNREAAAVSSDASHYDSISISEEDKNSFRMEVVSRLSHEIRTATTTGRIRELHQQVASGNYHPDPARIARCMLYQLEG